MAHYFGTISSCLSIFKLPIDLSFANIVLLSLVVWICSRFQTQKLHRSEKFRQNRKREVFSSRILREVLVQVSTVLVFAVSVCRLVRFSFSDLVLTWRYFCPSTKFFQNCTLMYMSTFFRAFGVWKGRGWRNQEFLTYLSDFSPAEGHVSQHTAALQVEMK